MNSTDIRLEKVKEAYINNTSDIELNSFKEIVFNAYEVLNISREQAIEIFNKLPSHIIGGFVSWGLSDTEASDNAYEYLLKNKDEFIGIVTP